MFGPAPALLYPVLGAVLWGGYLFGLKRYFVSYPGPVINVVVNACAVAWVTVGLALAAVTGVMPGTVGVSFGGVGIVDAGSVLVTLVGAAAGFLLVVRALQAGEVSYVAPISKVVPLFVLPLDVALLHPDIGAPQVAGVFVVTAAIYLANYEGGALLEPVRRTASSRAAQFALASAAAYAVSDVGKRYVLHDVGVPVVAWIPLVLGGVGLLLVPAAVDHWPADGVRRDLPRFVAMGGLAALATLVTAISFTRASASVAAAILNGQAVVAVVLGGVVLRERRLRLRLTAAGLTVLGVGLLAL